MARNRRSKRGVTSWVTCAALLLFGLLTLAAGCSSPDGATLEGLASTSQALACSGCPGTNPCAEWSCNTLTGKCTARPLLEEGQICTDKGSAFKGVCHLNLCCPGCVALIKGSPPACAPRGGVEDVRCGASGETCSNCNSDPCQAGACVNQAC